jgi:hypothetical protein
MPDYFKYFPITTYEGTRVTDISRRFRILETLDSDPFAYYPYTVKENERPEDIANLYYGDVSLTWAILLANNIIDVDNDWPMGQFDFEYYIAEKYLDRYKQWLYKAMPKKFADIRSTMEQILLAYVTDKNVTFADLSLDSKYESFFNFVKEDTLDFNGTGNLTLEDYYIIVSLESYEGALRNYIIDLYEEEDPLRRVLEFTQNTKINDNIVYVEGKLPNEVTPVRYNNESFYDISYYEEGAVNEDSEIYVAPLGAEWTKFRIYEYENILNENKRVIRLVNKEYANQLRREIRNIF